MRPILVTASLLTALATLVVDPTSAGASGDIFGDTAPSSGLGDDGSVGSKNGFSSVPLPLLIGCSVGTLASLTYDFPIFVGAPNRKLPIAWHAYGAVAGGLGVGFGTATIVDGSLVHDGVGGIVFGGVATTLGGVALVGSLAQLFRRPGSTLPDETPLHAAIVKRGGRFRLSIPAPTTVFDVRREPTPIVPLFAGTL